MRFATKLVLVTALAFLSCFSVSAQQVTGTVSGRISDPSGAAITGARIVLTSPGIDKRSLVSGKDGTFRFDGLTIGVYTLAVNAPGFAEATVQAPGTPTTSLHLLQIKLHVAAQEVQVQVNADDNAVSTDPDRNGNAMVLKGDDLNVLSNDPDEMLAELEALAGPAAGPNGGEIYIDGFTGGQLPPKSAILEIRVNQNPFSAQYERLGYGRIDIVTKPGSQTWHGQLGARGNDAAFNSRNPLLSGAPPPYYSYDVNGTLSGPLGHHASFIVSAFSPSHQNTSVVSAVDPGSVSSENPSGTAFSTAYTSPNSRFEITPRIDFQLGNSNVASLRYTFARQSAFDQGIGQTSLLPQAYNASSEESDLQFNDTVLINAHVADDIRVQYRRIRSSQTVTSNAPAAIVQGAFTSGGNILGDLTDHQNDLEFEDLLTATVAQHTLRSGVHDRIYNDTNWSTAQQNGAYTFSSTEAYLDRQPQKYSVAVIKDPIARITLSDVALFFQDDWKMKPSFTLSYGLRWETQNHIHDTSDLAPRVSLAWAPPVLNHKGATKTVLRAGYGWFFQRFTVANAFAGASSTPYLTTVLHQNGVNQQVFTVTDPSGYTESAPGIPVKPDTPLSSARAPTIYSVNNNFHAALDMQAAVGVDRQIAPGVSANITYLNSRGIHQYFTNNIGAPFFSTAGQNTYPLQPLNPASSNLMQFQSGGVYRQHQVIASVNAHVRSVGLSGYYAYTQAHGDTNGVTYVPSVSEDPGLDYGRTSFDVHHRLMIEGSVNLPLQFLLAPMFVFNSGAPFNITTGTDLTGNNQFNARPAFGSSSSCSTSNTDYVSTPWGCLDENPFGKDERIVPYGLATGPDNIALNLRLSKTIGIGPRQTSAAGTQGDGPPPPPQGGLGRSGLSGSGSGGPSPPVVSLPRRYNLSFSVVAHNVTNTQNLGTPNPVLLAPESLRFRSQSLAGGPFSPPEGGNRSIFLETRFSF